jgi:multidrug efflux pump subunit AcrB
MSARDLARSIAGGFFREPQAAWLLVLLALVAGAVAIERLPRTEDPKLVNRYALVETLLPGADAERVEALITAKLEDELERIEQIGLSISTSRTGYSGIRLELDTRITDDRAAEQVWSKVRTRLQQVASRLPAGSLGPELIEQDVSAKAMIAALTWDGPPEAAPLGLMTRLAEQLGDRLERLPGTKQIEIGGAVEERLELAVPAERLAELGLGAADLARRLERGDAKLPAGRLFDPRQELSLEVAGEFLDLERIRSLPVAQGAHGAELQAGDVGSLRRTWGEPEPDLALVDGRRAVVVAALIEPDQRIDRWAQQAHAELERQRGDLAPPLGLELLFDQSVFTRARLANLAVNLGLGALAVLGVLLFCMGWRQALLVASILPLASALTLAGMQVFGIEIHQMSVTGLIIALGLLIDNAIVMVDEVRHLRHQGRAPEEAAREGAAHLFLPLTSSTLTTVLAFMPIVLMPGPAGEFVSAIGITVILALSSSLLLALTILPAWAARLPPAADQGRGWWNHGLRSAGLAKRYEGLLVRLLQRPRLAAVGLCLPSLLGFVAATSLPEQFFPPSDRNQFQAQLWLPQGASLERSTEAALEVERLARTLDGIERVHVFVGKSAPKFYYNIPEGTSGAPFYAQALIEVRNPRDTPRLANRLQALLDVALPEAQSVVRLLEQGPPFEAPVELRVFGPDLAELARLGQQLRERITRLPGVIHTRQTLDDGRAVFELAGSERGWLTAGRRPLDLAAELASLTEGQRGGSLLEATVELPLFVRLEASGRRDFERLSELALAADTKRLPLDALARLERRPAFASIPHRDGERLTDVQGFLAAGLLPSLTLAALEAELERDPLALPEGYRIEVGGESAERDDAVSDLAGSVGILVVLMLATLVLSFGSYRLSALIFVVAGLSIGLGLLAIYVFGYPFGFMAIIGSMGLVGVAINDSIVVLTDLSTDPLARTGQPQAMARVVRRATGHVLATTLTTMAGFLPLIIAGGQFWPPLAVAIGMGVAGATLIALGLVPVAFRLSRRRAERQLA